MEKQALFTELVAKLILRCTAEGYQVTLGEAYRFPEWAKQLAASGRGTPRSLHCERLAIDLNLFRDGQWLMTTEDHQPIGEWWEQQHGLCRWGGRFGDGNHYSVEHDGRK